MTLTPMDTSYLEHLRSATRRTLQEALAGAPRDVALLDVPTHRNLGDSLIWEGTVQYLQSLGHRVAYTADIKRFRDEHLRRISGDAALILHGGGNLGDLWPSQEPFRHHIVRAYPSRRIILMPQSIHFVDEAALVASARAYRLAENLTILLRESGSMDVASQYFSGIDYRFCHDAALGVCVSHLRTRSHPPVILARRDMEARSTDKGFTTEVQTVDWSASPLNRWLFRQFAWQKNAFFLLPRGLQRRSSAPGWPYLAMRRLNVSAAVQQLSGAAWIVTNRLHAHVLAVLLGIPNVVTDNTYGKVSRIFKEYTGAFSTAHWAESLAQAEMLADSGLVGDAPRPSG